MSTMPACGDESAPYRLTGHTPIVLLPGYFQINQI